MTVTETPPEVEIPDTHAGVVSRMNEIKPEFQTLIEAETHTPDQVERFNSLAGEWDALQAKHDQHAPVDRNRTSAAAAKLARFADVADARTDGTPDLSGSFERDPLGDPRDTDVSRNENPWDIDVVQRTSEPEELFSRALSAVELTPGPADARREALTRMLESTDEGEKMAQLILRSTSPAYKRAYGKLAKHDGDLARAGLTDDERAAFAFADSLRGEIARAFSINTGASSAGLLVPTDIEPVVTISSDGTTNPIYNVGRRVQTVATTYRVVASPHATWSWDGENTEVSDDTPTTTNVDIPLEIAQGFVPYSIATEQAVANITAQVAEILAGGWNDLTGAALTTGTGSSQPTGIITALTGGSSEVASATTDTFAVADVYSVFDALPARHRRNSQWMTAIDILSDIRQFATDDGHALLARLGDGDEQRLRGKVWHENEDMDGTINAAAENYIAVVGDWRNFVIAEALGMLTEFVPQVFGSNGRPTGARGIFAQTRFGSDSVLDAAFRMLNVT